LLLQVANPKNRKNSNINLKADLRIIFI